ncbi:MAG: rRNA maturation RNase YbeY [Robiginitomaculum sp.]|nr:rRNA maturation RNase YbeY [Robiginitomaculum sp.]MDQ7078723.1 rRNA maturation RNase YbeY [Robiginitomaculum sp.]
MPETPREIDVRISGADWPLDEATAQLLVRDVLDAAEARLGPMRTGTVEVWFADDEDLRALNRQYRGKDAPTNVLSFAAPESPVPHFTPSLGQLALGFGVCADEAQSRSLDILDHTRHLVLHGLLHLQGYDHEQAEEAEKMETLERDIMKALGLHDPYTLAGADDV